MAASGVTADGSGFADERQRVLATTFTSFGGGVKLAGAATTIAAATTLTSDDAGKLFLVSQAAAYNITLPPLRDNVGAKFTFVVNVAAANTVVIIVPAGGTAPSAAPLMGTRFNNTAVASVASGNRINFITGAAAVGDYVEVTYGGWSATVDATNVVPIRAVCSIAGGITITTV